MIYINSKHGIRREFKKAQHAFFQAKKISYLFNIICILSFINVLGSIFLSNITWAILFVILMSVSFMAKIQLMEMQVQNMRYWGTKYTILHGWRHK